MSKFGEKRGRAVVQEALKFSRLVDNIRSATTRALEQIADDWDCSHCGLAGIPMDALCPTCNPQNK